MSDKDLRLIEDYLPIAEISKEASREKSVRKGHISTLHLWWARRPLVACRAAVYGALVPADRWVPDVTLHNPPDDPARAEAMKNGVKRGLNRRQARDFVSALCKYPGDPRVIDQARQHILDAHAQRLSAEIAEARKTGKRHAWMDEFEWDSGEPGRGQGDTVTAKDIAEGRAPRPRVLDMFAGGGAIPLEALRLGCEAHALDLNPVAHIIQLCTLVYPQKYGKPDPTARGMRGKPGPDGKPTWGGLAEEVRFWGHWVLEKVKREIGDLYPPVPDSRRWQTPPEIAFDNESGRWRITRPGKASKDWRGDASKLGGKQMRIRGHEDDNEDDAGEAALPDGFLQPVAYLWTRTVRCKNPSCAATVPLVRQTWLCKKAGRCVALKMNAPKGKKRVRFEVVESPREDGLGFDPAGFSEAGNATCPFCGTVADNDYVKAEGRAGRMGTQPMAVVCTRPGARGKVYFAADDLPARLLPDDDAIRVRIAELCPRTGLTVPDEIIEINPRSMDVDRWGLTRFCDLFTPRQMLSLLTFTAAVREVHPLIPEPEHAKTVATYLGTATDREAEDLSVICRWNPNAEKMQGTFGRQALPMVWDCCETNVFGGSVGDWQSLVDLQLNAIEGADQSSQDVAKPARSSATALPYGDGLLDAVITDPPYYDNVSYANLSDFFYVWLKRSIGHLYPEHFATALTPKKAEVIAAFYRHNDSKQRARAAYEEMMAQSLAEAHRVLKPGGTLAVVYAHKTTLGWSTLVDALRRAGFTVTEAWPLDTEMKSRLIAMETAALASSIFLVGRKRPAGSGRGNYEDDVQPELEEIVRERVGTLWDMGITGADLVIACVGAGLRAFTKYERVEYASGEPVPADKFLAEVEAVVLDTLMARLMATTRKAVEGDEETGAAAAGVGGIDAASRFYILWRYLYKAAELDAGEAIIFANGLHVELDGQGGLCDGRDAILEKKKSKYRLRDFTERGAVEGIGLPDDAGRAAPLIDVLHRTVYLMEHRPAVLREYLDQARPNRERLRLLAASLVGPGLSGKSEEDASRLVATTAAEQLALGKLLANWRTLVPETLFNAGKR